MGSDEEAYRLARRPHSRTLNSGGTVMRDHPIFMTELDAAKLRGLLAAFATDRRAGQADVAAQRVSVLAPIGTALLGYREGDEVERPTPGGLRRLRIEKVTQSRTAFCTSCRAMRSSCRKARSERPGAAICIARAQRRRSSFAACAFRLRSLARQRSVQILKSVQHDQIKAAGARSGQLASPGHRAGRATSSEARRHG
jgi:hypothetical protein